MTVPSLPQGRWLSGELASVCNVAREEAARCGRAPSVKVFWGDARWSRAQVRRILRGPLHPYLQCIVHVRCAVLSPTLTCALHVSALLTTRQPHAP